MKKRKDGRYQRQIYLGKNQAVDKNGNSRFDEHGEPIMVAEYFYVYGNSQKEVNEAWAQAKIDHGKGVDIKAANDNFKLWADRFIANKESRGLSHGHIDRLRSDLKHLAPLNDIPLSKITIGDIQSIIDALAKWHDGREGLAKKTLGSIRQTAGGVLKMAIASRVLTYNPAEYVTIPDSAPQKQREPVGEDVQRWINDTEHRAKRAAMIMLYAGLRRGELLALTWADVDIEAATISVNKTVQFNKGLPEIAHGKAKTAAGLRVVDIPKKLCTYLEAERQKDNCVYIIHNKHGGLLSSTGWRRLWESYMAELNVRHGFTEQEKEEENINSRFHPAKLPMRIKPFTAHQLRHTYITLLYLAGVDILNARDQAGHADVKTTMQIYTHLDKIHKRKGMNKLDDYLCLSDACQAQSNNTLMRYNSQKA